MADLQLDDEIETGWGRDPGEVIPLTQRIARSLNIFGSKLVDRMFSVFSRGIKATRDVLRDRALWTDVDTFFWQDETGTERPAVWGTRNQFHGFIFRKSPNVPEVIYFKVRNKYTDGEVQLAISSDAAVPGGVMFSIGVAEDLNGPYTTYSPESPLYFDPSSPQPQRLTISCGTLTTGKTYYYRLVRESGHQGDTLNADVVVTEVRVR